MPDFACTRVSSPDRLRELVAVFGDAFEEPDTYQRAMPDDGYLTGLLSKPYFISIAATMDDRVIGGLAAYELEKFEQQRSEIYLYDLAVLRAHRRKGVATALIRELVRVARSRNAWVVFVQADAGDEPAVRLYESLGVREDVIHFDIPVRDSEERVAH